MADYLAGCNVLNQIIAIIGQKQWDELDAEYEFSKFSHPTECLEYIEPINPEDVLYTFLSINTKEILKLKKEMTTREIVKTMYNQYLIYTFDRNIIDLRFPLKTFKRILVKRFRLYSRQKIKLAELIIDYVSGSAGSDKIIAMIGQSRWDELNAEWGFSQDSYLYENDDEYDIVDKEF
jgi:hypothetical protein